MKKTMVVALACLSIFGMNAQKKANGTIYIEHPAIKVVENFNKAFVNGEVDKVVTFVTDDFRSFDPSSNNPLGSDKAALIKEVTSWKNNYEYTSLTKQKGAYPDALEYKDDLQNGEVWVQTWEHLKGTHKQTGVQVDLPIHRSYIVTKDLKIKALIMYLDSRPFDQVFYSKSEQKNGEIYINHPNINTVRRMMAAFEHQDFDKYTIFYDENLKLSDINSIDFNKNFSLKELIAIDKNFHQNFDLEKVEQVGYPDYLQYDLMNMGVVYSWWNYNVVRKSDKKKMVLPMMISSEFNEKGKIINQILYYSQKVLESK